MSCRTINFSDTQSLAVEPMRMNEAFMATKALDSISDESKSVQRGNTSNDIHLYSEDDNNTHNENGAEVGKLL